jgi:dienelactone hydrolase
MFYALPTIVCLLSSISFSAAGDTVLYERFEGTTTGSVHGKVAFVPDVVGYGGISVENKSCARFDGEVATGIHFGPETIVTGPDFTVEAFVRPSGIWDYAAIASQGDEEGNQRSWALVLCPGNCLRFDVMADGKFDGGNKLETPARVVHEDSWAHVAAVCKGDTSRIYVNGYLVAEKKRATPGIFKSERFPITIGNIGHFAGKPRPFNGMIDEVRITPRALTPDEFIKTREPMPEQTGPVPTKYEMPFVAKTAEEAVAWQKQVRKRLFELVSARVKQHATAERPLDFKIESSEDHTTYTLHHASFQGNDGQRFKCLWTVPKGKGPFPGMLCLHGHGGKAEDVFDVKTPYRAFAEHLAQGGYCCLAPSFPHRTFAAEALWDLVRCVDILNAAKEVDNKRIGVMGLSMGGEWTMWIGACDERLKVIVVSGWMCTTEGVFEVFNCPCWELPGFVELMNVCEVNLLMAPRPVLFESAESDPCFPFKACKQGFERIKAGYKVFGAADATEQATFPGGHAVNGKKAFPFIDKVLGGKAADTLTAAAKP